MKKLAVMLIVVFFCANYSAAEQKNIPAVVVSSADVIKEMEEIIASSYYRQDINARAFAEDLFIGKSSSDDPHSQYFPPVQRQALENEMRGIIYGIGVLIERKTVRNKKSVKSFLSVEEVIKDGPAEHAGIRLGDYIIAVASDGVKEHLIFFDGKNTEKAINLIQGEKGAPVCIRVLRRGKKLDFLIVRDEIKQKIVFGKFIRPGIGYIYLAEFLGENMPDDFSVLVSSMQKNGMKVLVWDLRNNSGGSLDYAVKMSRWFQKYGDNKPIVVLKGKDITLIDTGRLTSNLASYEYFVGERKIKVDKIGVSPTIEIKNPKNARNEKEDAQFQRAIKEAEMLIK